MPVRAVLDTNALVSGLLAEAGSPRQVLDAWLERRHTLVTSLYLVGELAHVLAYPRIAQRLLATDEEGEALLAALLSQAAVVAGKPHLPGATRDPKDDAVVACVGEGAADYIVSGDQDLLVLGTYEGIQVVTPHQFIGVLAGSDAL